jgi:hypothetical protein
MTWYANRVVCNVLEEMRESLKLLDELNIKNYRSVMAMLIEETQSMVNRMEAAIGNKNDIEEMIVIRRELKKQIKKLKESKDDAK